MIDKDYRWYGFRYQEAMRQLEHAYEGSLKALDNNLYNVELEETNKSVWESFSKIMSEGDLQQKMTKPADDPFLEWRKEDAVRAISDLNKAFLVVAYHTLERHGKSWLELEGSRRSAQEWWEKLPQFLEPFGLTVSDKFTQIRKTVNSIKHDFSDVQITKEEFRSFLKSLFASGLQSDSKIYAAQDKKS